MNGVYVIFRDTIPSMLILIIIIITIRTHNSNKSFPRKCLARTTGLSIKQEITP
jgi:hypothetical protein